jgi:HAD superfamily hydrolase (TIGR01549 family)
MPLTNSPNGSTPSGDYSHITTIIFDMDGTLIRHTWRLEEITAALFARFAVELAPLTHTEFFTVYWPKNEDMWYMMVDGVLDGETAAKYGYVNTLRTLGLDEALAGPMVDCWRELVLQEAAPFDDTFAVLATLRNRYATGILTNGFTGLQRGKINRYNLADYVDFTLVSEEVGHHKPAKEVFLKALELAGNVSPEETLYVGDSLIADIQGARNAGITPILMNPQDDVRPPYEVIKIRRLAELLPLLKIEV